MNDAKIVTSKLVLSDILLQARPDLLNLAKQYCLPTGDKVCECLTLWRDKAFKPPQTFSLFSSPGYREYSPMNTSEQISLY